MQQVIHPINGLIHGKVNIPGTKSITNRALLLAALADGVSEISGIRINDDTRTLINALSQLGIVTQLDEKSCSCIIAGGNGKFPKRQTSIWCAESDVVARFILAACAATPGVFYLDGSAKLRKKSLAHLIQILCRQGAQILPGDALHLPLTLVGADTLEGGEIILDDALHSQLISALLLISPYGRLPLSFIVNNTINQPLIEMTCSMMAEFGVLVHRIHQGQFLVPVPQRYQANDYIIEPDFAIAANFFAAAAVTGGEISIQAAKRSQSKQTSIKLISILEKMGCHTYESLTGLTLKGSTSLHGIDVNLRDFTDTFATLAAIAPFANSPTLITHHGNLRPQEIKRMLAVKTELSKLGIQVETGDNWIKIYPGLPRSGVIDSHHDHRIGMAFSIIGLKVPGISIANAECVTKNCPEFFSLWDRLTKKASVHV